MGGGQVSELAQRRDDAQRRETSWVVRLQVAHLLGVGDRFIVPLQPAQVNRQRRVGQGIVRLRGENLV